MNNHTAACDGRGAVVIVNKLAGLTLLSSLARSLVRMPPSRAAAQAGLAALMIFVSAPSVHDATASGETRTLSFHHTHSGEDLTVTFKREGRYDEAALKKLNWFLRDWRTQEPHEMDRHLFDVIWEVYRDVDAKKPIQIISAYRSPATNAMLRRRSSGVARYSQHMLGHAMDFFIPGVPLEQIRFAGLRLQRGGVGFYPTSGSPFVHLDVGHVRHWPRMTHDQLVRLFPDGRTVHIPSDGVPLKNYALAMADIEHRGNGDTPQPATNKTRSLLASLFGRQNREDDEDADSSSTASIAATATHGPVKTAAAIPVPRSRPVQILRVADATPRSTSPQTRPATVASRPQTPADIINGRGFWDEAVDNTAPAKRGPAGPIVTASAGPETTASLPAAITTADSGVQHDGKAKLALAYAAVPAALGIRQAHASTIETERAVRASAANYGGVIAKVEPSATYRLAPVNDPWTRAMILTPDTRQFLTANALGTPDTAMIASLMRKPRAAVMMSFADDAYTGFSDARFEGKAVSFVEVVTFPMQTAALAE